MRLSTIAASSALFLACVQASGEVVNLGSSNFASEVGSGLTLVKYFAPWCGHCKTLAPEYVEAAAELASRNIKLAEVDCTVEQELCQEAGIRGYPSLKVFRNGSPTDYSGPRKKDGIVSYMLKQALPAISEVTADKHDEFKAADRVVVIAYASESDLPASFKTVAESLRDSFLFGYADKSLSPTGKSEVVLYKKFDDGQAILPLSSPDVALKEFIKENSIPLMDEVGPENFASYAEQGLPLAYLFWDPSDAAGREKMTAAVKPVAKQYKGRVNFVTIDSAKFSEHGKSLNIPEGAAPAFVIQDIANKGRKYVLPEMGKKLSSDKIEGFMRDYEDGKVKPSIKSEPIPEEQDDSVYKLVADEFDDVLKRGKDVFVAFTAPWCGHCQRLAPIWESLADEFEGLHNAPIIGSFVATENDLPLSVPWELSGFPTLKIYKAATGTWEDYNGDRSLDSLRSFVHEHSPHASSNTSTADEPEEGATEHDEL